MPIPSQDKLVEYLQTTADQPLTEDPMAGINELQGQIDSIQNPFQTKIMSSRMAREEVRKNLKDLEMILGKSLNVTV